LSELTAGLLSRLHVQVSAKTWLIFDEDCATKLPLLFPMSELQRHQLSPWWPQRRLRLCASWRRRRGSPAAASFVEAKTEASGPCGSLAKDVNKGSNFFARTMPVGSLWQLQ